MKSSKRWLAVILVIGLLAPAGAQSPRDAAWNSVIAKQREGFRLLDLERRAAGAQQQQLYVQRLRAFRTAVANLRSYTANFVADPSTVSYVNAGFQAGFYMEYAGWEQEALLRYYECRVHPKLRDRAATFGEPTRPLAPLVEERINTLEARFKQRGGGSSAHDLFAFAKYEGKGGIDLRGIKPPPALSMEQSINVAQRLSFPQDLARARVSWRQLIDQQSQLQPIREDASVPGILVYGVRASQANTALVASTLGAFRQQLASRYFDSGLPAPTMVVFANLGEPGVDTTPASNAPPTFPGRVPNPNELVFAPEIVNSIGMPPSPPKGPLNAANTIRPPNAVQLPIEQRQAPVQQRPPEQMQTQQPVDQRPLEQRQLDTRQMEQRRLDPPSSSTPYMDSEAVGRMLSRTLHFRDMEDMEGYFEPLDHTLVLRKNLAFQNGQLALGTALHELVHAMIQADYPLAPVWLNEGMAAMHEEFGPDIPHDNYRLYVAREAMSAGRWPTLQQLLEPHPEWWNSNARPVMMAAARYFCMYLATEGQLSRAYKAFRDGQAGGDVSPGILLTQATGMSVDQLQVRWQQDLMRRDLNLMDSRFRELREPIRRYVGQLPAIESWN